MQPYLELRMKSIEMEASFDLNDAFMTQCGPQDDSRWKQRVREVFSYPSNGSESRVYERYRKMMINDSLCQFPPDVMFMMSDAELADYLIVRGYKVPEIGQYGGATTQSIDDSRRDIIMAECLLRVAITPPIDAIRYLQNAFRDVDNAHTASLLVNLWDDKAREVLRMLPRMTGKDLLMRIMVSDAVLFRDVILETLWSKPVSIIHDVPSRDLLIIVNSHLSDINSWFYDVNDHDLLRLYDALQDMARTYQGQGFTLNALSIRRIEERLAVSEQNHESHRFNVRPLRPRSRLRLEKMSG